MQRSVSLVAVCVLVVGLSLVAGVAIAQEEPTPSPADNETATPADGETATPIDQHDDPDNVSEEGDLGALSDWLGGHLTDRLEGSAIQLSQGQYESVEGLLGDEFESRLSQYVDVAGETNAAGDDRTADRVEAVADDQRELSADVAAYRETHDEYRAARDAGDEETARARARELADLADQVQREGSDVQAGYRAIENGSGRDLSAGQTAIADVVANVSETQAEVRATTFVETRLSVTANRSVAAFDRPARIEGQLFAENGSVLADRSVTIQVGHRRTGVTTDAAGRFSITYRPVSIRADVERVPVVYHPRPASAFLGSSENVSLSIEPVEPTVTIDEAVDVVAYGEPVSVDAAVTVDGRPVPNVSASLAFDDGGLASGRTGSAGDVTLSPRLPAAIAVGERTSTIVAGSEGRAIAPATTTTTVTVEETATELTVTGESDGGPLVVRGTLRTDDGRPVANQSVTVAAGAASETVRTDGAGAYTASFDRDTMGEARRTVSVTATFDGTGTNLGGANATTTAQLPPASEAGGDGTGGGGDASDASAADEIPWAVVAVGLAALLALGAIVVGYVRWSGPAYEEATEPVEEGDGPVATTSEAQRWLAGARTALESGDDRSAIARAYAASYAHLQDRLGVGEDRTPRELVAAAETGLDGEELTALSTVADGYEQTTFAGMGDVGAAGVIESATRLVDDETAPSTAD